MSKTLFLSFAGILFFWNLITFLMMGIDKYKAQKGRWRIAEKTLLISAFCFGSLGALLGMHFFHHKTRHWYFRWGLPIFFLLHLGAAFWLIFQGKF